MKETSTLLLNMTTLLQCFQSRFSGLRMAIRWKASRKRLTLTWLLAVSLVASNCGRNGEVGKGEGNKQNALELSVTKIDNGTAGKGDEPRPQEKKEQRDYEALKRRLELGSTSTMATRYGLRSKISKDSKINSDHSPQWYDNRLMEIRKFRENHSHSSTLTELEGFENKLLELRKKAIVREERESLVTEFFEQKQAIRRGITANLNSLRYRNSRKASEIKRAQEVYKQAQGNLEWSRSSVRQNQNTLWRHQNNLRRGWRSELRRIGGGKISQGEARRIINNGWNEVNRRQNAVNQAKAGVRKADRYSIGIRVLDQMAARVDAVSDRLEALNQSWSLAEKALRKNLPDNYLAIQNAFASIDASGANQLRWILREVESLNAQMNALDPNRSRLTPSYR